KSHVNEVSARDLRQALLLVEASDLFNIDYHSPKIEEILKMLKENGVRGDMLEKVEFSLIVYYILNERYEDASGELGSISDSNMRRKFITALVEDILGKKMTDEMKQVLYEHMGLSNI
ncbi:MAG: hypothetical protein D6831_03800, partial [Aquificota bacterium]